MPTFDGKSEKFELFEDLVQTKLKIHSQLTEEEKINTFHSLMRGDALQKIKNITRPNGENLREFLTVFLRKYVEPPSMATAKTKFHRLVFNPANQKFSRCIRICRSGDHWANLICQNALHLKKTIIQAPLENGTYEQIVSHLENKLELKGLEAQDELQINTVTQQTTQQNSEKSETTCHDYKKPGHYPK